MLAVGVERQSSTTGRLETTAGGGGGCQKLRGASHASARVGHALASKIYLQAHAGRTATRLTMNQRGRARDHGGMEQLGLELLEVHRIDFDKNQSKSFKESAKPRLRTVDWGLKQIVCSGEDADGVARPGEIAIDDG